MGTQQTYYGAVNEIAVPGCNAVRASTPTEAANTFAREYMDDYIEREAEICVIDERGDFWISDAELSCISHGWHAHEADGPLSHREAYDRLRLPADEWEDHEEYHQRLAAEATKGAS